MKRMILTMTKISSHVACGDFLIVAWYLKINIVLLFNCS